MIVVTQQPWSIENGMLTPTMKIRRSQIEASVEAQLPNWYASQARVQWH
jgi:long-chain acyl-CoA synthetase